MDAEALFAHELETIFLERQDSKVANGDLGDSSPKPFSLNEIVGTNLQIMSPSAIKYAPLGLQPDLRFTLKVSWP